MEVCYGILILISVALYVQDSIAINFPHLEGSDEVDIQITEYIPSNSRHKRSSDGFPDELDVGFPVEGQAVELKLKRNADIRTDTPIYLMRGEQIVRHQIADNILKEQIVAYYYDIKNGSSFMAWHMNRQANNEAQYALRFKASAVLKTIKHTRRENPEDGLIQVVPDIPDFGTFSLGNKDYQIQPVEEDHVATDVSSVTHTLSLIPVKIPRIIDAIEENGQDHDRIKREAERGKRQAVPLYEIESFFVVDFSVYSFWYDKTNSSTPNRADVILNNINQFYAFILNAINVRYTSVTGSFTMTCLYSGIYIADTSNAAPFIENNLLTDDGSARRKTDVDVALPAFRDWSNTNLSTTHDYDHAFMFTAYDLGSIDNGVFNDAVAGYAYVGGVCGSDRYSINQDYFHTLLATVAAHELGHNLGSAHDGTGNACDGTAGFVMAASSSITFDDLTFNTRQFSFSSCSVTYFSSNLDTLGSPNCLESRSSSYNSSALAAYTDDLAGQVYPPDTQCEYIIGSGSYFYRNGYSSYEDICGLLRCSFTNNNGSIWAQLPWEGTTCASGKLCQGGSCVSSAAAPTGLNDSCLFGDIPYNVQSQSETCVEFVGPANKSYNCYQAIYSSLCCATCELHRQANVNRTDCEYGDKSSGCATLSRSGCYSNAALCCQSCAEQESTIPNCLYGDQDSWCATLARIDCYANDATCCEHCYNLASSNTDCLYGDRATSCDPTACSSYTEETRNSTCCESCAESTTTSTTTPTTTVTSTSTSTVTSTSTSTASVTTTSTTTVTSTSSTTASTSSTATPTSTVTSTSTTPTTTSTTTSTVTPLTPTTTSTTTSTVTSMSTSSTTPSTTTPTSQNTAGPTTTTTLATTSTSSNNDNGSSSVIAETFIVYISLFMVALNYVAA